MYYVPAEFINRHVSEDHKMSKRFLVDTINKRATDWRGVKYESKRLQKNEGKPDTQITTSQHETSASNEGFQLSVYRLNVSPAKVYKGAKQLTPKKSTNEDTFEDALNLLPPMPTLHTPVKTSPFIAPGPGDIGETLSAPLQADCQPTQPSSVQHQHQQSVNYQQSDYHAAQQYYHQQQQYYEMYLARFQPPPGYGPPQFQVPPPPQFPPAIVPQGYVLPDGMPPSGVPSGSVPPPPNQRQAKTPPAWVSCAPATSA